MSLLLSTKRHSLSHIMAQATRMVMGPNALLAIGPNVDNGWYYDIDFGDTTLEESKLRDIEKKMRSIVREGQEFRQFSLSVADAKTFTKALGEIYKLEMIEDLEARGETTISFFANIGKFQNPAYKDFAFLENPLTVAVVENGEISVPVIARDEAIQEPGSPRSTIAPLAMTETGFDFRTSTFIDMCQGPHVMKTSDIPEDSFKLDKLAGAYWRGDAKNKQLTRIYGLAFESKVELDAYEVMMEEAKKRDHRILGKKLKLFSFSDMVGAGLPLWLPNGATIRRELERFIVDTEIEWGYLHVNTPDIAKLDLYKTSGHYPYYKDSMYAPIKIEEDEYMLRPMTCPHHFQVYTDEPHSYRELPMRIAELAKLYRYEASGELSGLVRVRGFCLADAHIICADPDQAKAEVSQALDLIEYIAKVFGLIQGDNFWYRLSLGDRKDDKKYYKNDAAWDQGENILRELLQERKCSFYEAEQEAAFYGPKIDIQMKDVKGKENTAFTVQYDFCMPDRFNLLYTDKEGNQVRPIVVHRSSIGAIERIMAFLIEHFAGTFPLWLAPEQVRIIPVGEAFIGYGDEVFQILKKSGLRVKLDDSTDSLGKKIRNAETEHANYILVVGEQEMNARSLAVRNFKTKAQSTESIKDFVSRVQEEIKNKSL